MTSELIFMNSNNQTIDDFRPLQPNILLFDTGENDFNKTNNNNNFSFTYPNLNILFQNAQSSYKTIDLWPDKFLICIYIIIFVVGLIGNFLVIYFVLFYKRMQSMTNKFITNLAVADLAVILVCVPVTVSRLIYKQWVLGEFLCRFSSFVQGVSLSVSVMTLTAISIDRFVIIYKPMKARSMCTNRKVKIVVLTIWILSLFIMSPLLIVFKYERNDILIFGYTHSFESCIERWPFFELKLSYEVLLIFFLYIFPTVFMSYAYFTITKVLWFVGDKNLNNEITSSQHIYNFDCNTHCKTININNENSRYSYESVKRSQINKHSNVSDDGNSKTNNNNNNNNNNDNNNSNKEEGINFVSENELTLNCKDESASNSKIHNLFIKCVKKNPKSNQIESTQELSISRNNSSRYRRGGSFNSKRSVKSSRSMKKRDSLKSSNNVLNNNNDDRLSNKPALNSLVYQLRIYDSFYKKNLKRAHSSPLTNHKMPQTSQNNIIELNSVNINSNNFINYESIKPTVSQQSTYIKQMNPRRNEIAIFKLIKSRKRVVKLLIILVMLFMCSWLPYHIIAISIEIILFREEKFKPTDSTVTNEFNNRNVKSLDDGGETISSLLSKNIYPMVLCIALANSASNPVCYMALSHGFRNKIISSFKSCFSRKSKTNVNNVNFANNRLNLIKKRANLINNHNLSKKL
jgi:hypothetical protein